MTAAVTVEGLRVAYGTTQALVGVDLTARGGSTLAVLGHNGAGKTTLIRVLTTLVPPTAGRAVVDGFDVAIDPHEVRRRIGVTGQYAGLDEFLTGRENLELVARLAGLGSRTRRRAGELVERLDLHDIAERRVGQLSGGARRRIDLAVSLVAAPAVLFLDEPTTGLDPTARAGLWDVVGELTTSGTTVVLTTQYLEEADRFADDVVVLDHGRVAARGTPAELKRLVGGKVVTATVPVDQLELVHLTPEVTRSIGLGQVAATFSVGGPEAAADLVGHLAHLSIDVADLEVTSPSLDDVFVHLTPAGGAS